MDGATQKFVNEEARTCVVPLEWPFDYGGKRWTEIRLRRMTIGELEQYQERLEAHDGNGPAPLFPMFDAPEEVIHRLDADDADEVNRRAQDFLPRRFRDRLSKSEPTSGSGEPSPQPSPDTSTSG